ncbi:hypothetical protein FFLO_00216 [Filobasidium floriforme]|uniref:tRNA-5-taurinomethyluridine 2-sulfurtransferase n=1 Tax=Filobasidium floriforme TaxID=5210 RepID=A0A8K0JTQ9_9TREE|nr:tRNA-specific 2-thiouridylase [Filobasidium floriforme]KAG7580008.1 hypothetical protein FFLO_00216 [Filobasidium floriforme]KAH8087408.1 tRNA-specific 2-thiouridylase [Filobasidium floriforme]
MSGGVDSSVALSLLASPHLPPGISPELAQKLPFTLPNHPSSSASFASSINPHGQIPLNPSRDLDISAIFMRNWSPLLSESDHPSWETDCAWEKDWEDVQRVCKVWDVPVRLIDLSQEYWLHVFEPAVQAWQAGSTPNPDVSCNKHVKFGALIDKALPERGGWLATGHYAATDKTSEGRTRLLRSADQLKDQTYYLSSCSESQLSRALFPLANLTKSTEVRELAKKFRLPTAEREESMGVCFIGEKRGKFGEFVGQYTTPEPTPGHLITPTGTILGQHAGLWHYTIGQRARIPGMKEKWFVASKRVGTNEVVVVPGADHQALCCRALRTSAKEFSWIAGVPPDGLDEEGGVRARCQVRHRMRDVPAVVRRMCSDLEIRFETPEKGVSPGQVVGLWDERGTWCLGSGVIDSTECVE